MYIRECLLLDQQIHIDIVLWARRILPDQGYRVMNKCTLCTLP
jgi:hypothetical protein